MLQDRGARGRVLVKLAVHSSSIQASASLVLFAQSGGRFNRCTVL
jgi:hypothetical protein